MERFRTKQLTKSIFALANQCNKLLNQGKQYEPLLNKMLEYYKRDEHIPQIKDLCKEINYDYSRFKKHLQQIYEDLLEMIGEENFVFDLRETIYTFYVFHPEKSLGFNARIAYEPKVGDVIECNFFQPYFYSNSFYVWHVYDKELFEDKIIVTIKLVHHSYMEGAKKSENYPILVRARQRHRELVKYLNEDK